MSGNPLPRLTDPELELMKILWSRERLSAREVHEAVGLSQGWAYSTTRTVLERMVEKGLVSKRPFHGIRLYEPAVSRATGLARLVREFATQVLEIDPAPVISLFAESDALSPEDVEELRALLDENGGESR